LQCVAVCCSVLQCVAVCCSVLQCVAVCCSVLQCVLCCSVLYCGAVCCSMLQQHCVCWVRRDAHRLYVAVCSVVYDVAVCCSVLQYIYTVSQYVDTPLHVQVSLRCSRALKLRVAVAVKNYVQVLVFCFSVFVCGERYFPCSRALKLCGGVVLRTSEGRCLCV